MAFLVMRLSHRPVDHRVLHGALSRLEPGAGKLARRVLRGRGDTVMSPRYPTTRLVLRTSWRAAKGRGGRRFSEEPFNSRSSQQPQAFRRARPRFFFLLPVFPARRGVPEFETELEVLFQAGYHQLRMDLRFMRYAG